MKAKVQVWSKGLAIAGRPREFNLIVPVQDSELKGLEVRLRGFDAWGPVIESLYALGESSVSRQFIVLFDSTEFLVVAVAPSEDQHHRPSVVLVAAQVTEIDWRDVKLAEYVSRAHGLCSRLANRYAQTLAGVPSNVAQQVRDGAFLPDREFDLTFEEGVERIGWDTIIEEIRRWRGITGLGTPILAPLGANVLYGTRDEVARAEVHEKAGTFDVARGKIEPIGDELALWEPPAPSESEVRVSGSEATPGPESIERLDQKVGSLLDVAEEVREMMRWIIDEIRGKKRRK